MRGFLSTYNPHTIGGGIAVFNNILSIIMWITNVNVKSVLHFGCWSSAISGSIGVLMYVNK